MRALAALLLLAAIGLGAPAAAQDGSEEPGAICVEGPRWQASLDETRRIEAEPVPTSFRTPFETVGGCQRWSLEPRLLVAWHLRFGSAATVAPALRYLEVDYAKRIGRLSRFKRLTAQRAEELAKVRDDVAFMAEQYLSAAEEFDDPRLLDEAEKYAVPLINAVALIKTRDPLVLPLYRELDRPDADDFAMRIAVLRAVISRNEADMWDARQLLERLKPLEAEEAAGVAYSAGSGFCDIADGGSRDEQVRLACKEDYYDVRVVTYITSLARLDLLTSYNHGNPRSFTDALRLLDKSREDCCLHFASDRLFQLHIGDADRHDRMRDAPGHGWGGELQALEAAEKLASPYEAPARFRRVAMRWLSAWARIKEDELDEKGRRSPDSYPQYQRYESYLRSTLANLDAITTGDMH